MIRLALAGGSDERPPHDEPRNAQIIRFPIERRMQSQGKPPIDRSPDDGRHGPAKARVNSGREFFPDTNEDGRPR
jgi:hypothetical protein